MTETPITVTIVRDNLRHFVAGFVLCGIIAVTWYAIPEPPDPAVARADSVANRITKAYIDSKRDDRRNTARLAVLNASADSAKRALRRPASANELQVQLASATAPVAPLDSSDTTKMVGFMRTSDQRVFPVPLFLMEQMRAFVDYTTKLEGAFQRVDAARLFAVDTEVPDLRRQLVMADSVIGAQRIQVETRDHARRPRCGKKCGVVIGVGATVLVAIAADKVRALVSQAPKSRALRVSAFQLLF